MVVCERAKCREPIFFPTRCVLSTTAPPVSTESTVLNLEKLKLSSLEVDSNSGTVDRQWSSSSSLTSTTAGVLDISINEPGTELSEEVEPTIEELQLLEEQLSTSITVRSKRQVEWKERRIRAAERAEAGVVFVKSASAGRAWVAPSTVSVKSGVSRRRGEKKDVLAFLGGMTNAKLLTAAEEVELSKGIQAA